MDNISLNMDSMDAITNNYLDDGVVKYNDDCSESGQSHSSTDCETVATAALSASEYITSDIHTLDVVNSCSDMAMVEVVLDQITIKHSMEHSAEHSLTCPIIETSKNTAVPLNQVPINIPAQFPIPLQAPIESNSVKTFQSKSIIKSSSDPLLNHMNDAQKKRKLTINPTATVISNITAHNNTHNTCSVIPPPSTACFTCSPTLYGKEPHQSYFPESVVKTALKTEAL
jgi:hypothetical protein